LTFNFAYNYFKSQSFFPDRLTFVTKKVYKRRLQLCFEE